jgi:hypothetical protein
MVDQFSLTRRDGGHHCPFLELKKWLLHRQYDQLVIIHGTLSKFTAHSWRIATLATSISPVMDAVP